MANTKRALLTSALAIVACVAMLIGSTFAWFTDSASTSVNKIEAGKLKLELLMKQAGTSIADRTVVAAANRRAEETGEPAVAIELPDGTIVTGKTSALLGASSAMLLNALKKLAGIAKEVKLIAPEIIEPIQKLKVGHLGNRNPRLHTDEVLIALSICAVNEPKAALALKQLEKLKCCEVHSTVILSSVDENVFKKLGINLTCEARYETKKLFHRN